MTGSKRRAVPTVLRFVSAALQVLAVLRLSGALPAMPVSPSGENAGFSSDSDTVLRHLLRQPAPAVQGSLQPSTVQKPAPEYLSGTNRWLSSGRVAGRGGDIGSDVRVAVAVAAHPRSKTDRNKFDGQFVAEVFFQLFVQFAQVIWYALPGCFPLRQSPIWLHLPGLDAAYGFHRYAMTGRLTGAGDASAGCVRSQRYLCYRAV